MFARKRFKYNAVFFFRLMKKESKSKTKQHKAGFFKTAFHEFNSSFKNIIKFPSFILVLIYTVLFFGASWLVLYLWSILTDKFISAVSNGAPANLMDATQAQLDLLSANIPKIYTYFIISGIILALLLIIVWVIFEGLAWLQMMEKKKTMMFFGKFTLLNILWMAIFGIIFAAGLFLLSNNYTGFIIFVVALAIIWLYLTTILYTVFTNNPKHKVFAALKNMFKTIAAKGHGILFHFLLATILFVAINLVMYLIMTIPGIPDLVYTILSAIIILIFVAWMQFYLVGVVKKEIE